MLRTLSDRTTVSQHQHNCHANDGGIRVINMRLDGYKLHIPHSMFDRESVNMLTFIFANILEGEGTASVLPLYNSNFAKSALANNTQ
jgi:hypothetical protein